MDKTLMKMMVVIMKMDKATDEVMKMVKRIKTVMVKKMLRKRIKLVKNRMVTLITIMGLHTTYPSTLVTATEKSPRAHMAQVLF